MVAVKDSRDVISSRQQQLHQRIFIKMVVSWFCFILGCHVCNLLQPPKHINNITSTHNNIDLDAPYYIKEDDPLDMFLGKYNLTHDNKARDILSASTNLINVGFASRDDVSISGNSYSGLVAEFCPLNFSSSLSWIKGDETFQDVIIRSNCGQGSKHIIRVDLGETIRLVYEYDAYIANLQNGVDSITYKQYISNYKIPTVLDLKGVVFHESKCGASLIAQSISALNPTKNRVYYEPGPPESAMKICAEGYSKCSMKASANLVKDVMYLMGRSNNQKEENVFFILQPEATRTIESFLVAFTTTPWLYLYRESIDVLQSQRESRIASFSVKETPMVQALLKKIKAPKLEELSTTEVHAAIIATFRWSVLRNFNEANNEANGLGLALKYSTSIISDFIEAIAPIHFHTPVDIKGRRRVRLLKKIINERDGVPPGPAGNKDKSIHSDDGVPKSMKKAAKKFLGKTFDQLQQSKYNLEQCYQEKPDHSVILHCPDTDDKDSED